MSQQQTFYPWVREVARQMPQLSKPQAFVLAAFSWGLALARRCTLSAVAEALPHLGKPDTVERRLQRFLANSSLGWQPTAQALARWVLAHFVSHGVVVLLVDETSLQERLKVMAVSLAYRGRALPLAWWCYRPKQWPMGQVELITTLLRFVAPAIPAGCRVLVQADRGIGTSPQLLRAIVRLGWYFLVRVQGQVRLVLEDGREVPFAQLVSQVGGRWSGRVYAFKKAGWQRYWAVGCWKAGCKQPWLLLTNWPQAQGNWYSLRMWEESAFKDFKSNGWQWQRSHVWEPEHANRLWLVMALAYAWVVSLGTQVIRCPAWRVQLTRGKGWRRSVFQLGLRWLKRTVELGGRLLCRLLLIPHFPSFPKCVVQ